MILTVTPNPALDKVIFIDQWKTSTLMTAKKTIFSVGGKGLDSSVVLRALNVKTTAIAFFAGKTGHEILQLVEAYGIDAEPIWVDGETRTAHVITEIEHHRHSHIFTGGIEISDDHLQQLITLYKEQLKFASYVICGGLIPDILPADFHRTIVDIAKTENVPTLIDSFGVFMQEAIKANPACVKLNQDEFRLTFGIDFENFDDLTTKANDVFISKKLQSLVVTCSADGILAFTQQGNFHAQPPKQKAVNAAGAGDAASAALAWRFSEGDTWESALMWAAAASAATVLTEGTGDCNFSDVKRLMPDVIIHSI